MNAYTGKILGSVLGFLTLGVIGGLAGFFVGHLFDSGQRSEFINFPRANPGASELLGRKRLRDSSTA